MGAQRHNQGDSGQGTQGVPRCYDRTKICCPTNEILHQLLICATIEDLSAKGSNQIIKNQYIHPLKQNT